MLSRLLLVLSLVPAAAAALLLLAWLGQRRFLYLAEREDLASAERRARSSGLEPWIEGGTFHGWRARHPSRGRGRLVVLHGNAGTAVDRAYCVLALSSALPELPLDVYLVEYPGYGPRPGSPSQPALVAAARAAIAAARREGGPVFVAGESLGSGVAALAAAEAPGEIDGLLLVTPLASVPAVARRHYPFLPAFVHRDAYRADQALPRYGGPVAFVLAGRDEVVFPDLGRALFDAYPGRKRLWVDEGAGHGSLDWRPGPRWREAVEFLAAAAGVTLPPSSPPAPRAPSPSPSDPTSPLPSPGRR